MSDRYGIAKIIGFALLAAIYFAGVAAVWAATGDIDITALTLVFGGVLVGGLAFGIGVIK